MFPVIKISVANLEPEAKYIITMDIVPVADNMYKFHNSEWVVTGKAEPSSPGRLYIHPDSPAPGSVWQTKIISFQKLKITSNHLDQLGYVRLCSSVCVCVCVCALEVVSDINTHASILLQGKRSSVVGQTVVLRTLSSCCLLRTL